MASSDKGDRASGGLVRKFFLASVLRYRDFRLLFAATVFESFGWIGEHVALGWVILTMTGSPFMVGLGLGLRHVPSFFLGLFAGVAADMVDRRKLMRTVNVFRALVVVGVGLLLLFDRAHLWHIFVLALANGALSDVYQTSRQSFAYDVVGPANALTGLAYVSLAMRIGGTAGALLVGLMLGKVSPASGYFWLTGGYLISAALVTMIRPGGRSAPRVRQPATRYVREFVTEIRQNNALLVIVVMVALVEVLGFSTEALLPSLARDRLEVGAEGLGILSAMKSAGGVLAMIMLSPFGEIRGRGSILTALILFIGASVILLGVASTFYVAVIAILVMSGMMALWDVFSQRLIQSVVPAELRGRAMGAWIVAVGTVPLGNMEIGALASAFGLMAALVSHGAVLMALAAASIIVFKRLLRQEQGEGPPRGGGADLV